EASLRVGKRSSDPYWKGILLASGEVDKRFALLKDIVAKDHPLPQDLLPSARSLLVIFVAFREELLEENSTGELPSRSWGLAYEATNRLIEEILEELKLSLEARGYQSLTTPPTHNFDRERLISLWSHKHLGYLVNLGTFGLNSQLITPLGCGGRLGSLVTEAPLPQTPSWKDQELCLHKKGLECQACIKACPANALEANGIKREACFKRLSYNIRSSPTLRGLKPTTHVCGKCVVVCPARLDRIPEGLRWVGF
ncbi:MAG: 4Fe-4S double cluster binding domain-containing protein, partial [Desulfatiglandales bacterium]